MSKIYKTEVTAKMVAGKKSKAGVKHLPVLTEEGWTVQTAEAVAAAQALTETTIKIPYLCWKAIAPIISKDGLKSVSLELVGKHINLMINGEKAWFFLDSRIADATLTDLKSQMGG